MASGIFDKDLPAGGIFDVDLALDGIFDVDLATNPSSGGGGGASYRTSVAGGDTTGTGNRSVTFPSPVVGDLLVVYCNAAGNSNFTPTCSDDQGGTYTLVTAIGHNFDSNTLSCFVRDSLISSAVSTVVTVATGVNDAAEIVVIAVQGMVLAGSAAVKQFASETNVTGGSTPAPAFATAASTGNITLGAVGNSSDPSGNVAPTGWTERQNAAQTAPSISIEAVTRDTGFTGTTITWGATSPTAYADIIVELNSPASSTPTLTFDQISIVPRAAVSLAAAILAGSFFSPVLPPTAAALTPLPSVSYPVWIAPSSGLPTKEQSAYFGVIPLERKIPLPAAIYPDAVPGRSYQTSEQLAFVAPGGVKPERSLAYSAGIFVDFHNPKTGLASYEQKAFALDPNPIPNAVVAPTFFQGSTPDVVYRSVFLAAEQRPFFFDSNPIPNVVTTTFFDAYFTERVPVRSGYPSFEQSGSFFDPKPERSATFFGVTAPDRVDAKSSLLIANHPFSSKLDPKPEIPISFFGSVYSDFVNPKNGLGVARQSFLAFDPKPEATLGLGAAFFPDRIFPRLGLPVAEQLAFALSPKPEQTSTFSGATFVDKINRVSGLAAYEQRPFFFDPNPLPAVTAPAFFQGYAPDAIYRPVYIAAEQKAFTFDPNPIPNAAVATFFAGYYPDSVSRVGFASFEQLVTPLEIPKPEETSTFFGAVYPDRYISRQGLLAYQQEAFALDPKPEEAISTGAAFFPNSHFLKQGLGSPLQRAIVSNIAPERSAPLAVSIYPDSIYRPTFLPAEQLVTPLETPKPEETSTFFGAYYPDLFLTKPSLGVASQLFSSKLDPKPEQVSTFFNASYPDLIARNQELSNEQVFSTSISPKPEASSVFFSAVYPDKVDRLSFLAGEQLSVSVVLQPPSVVPTYFGAIYPDFVIRNQELASEQKVTPILPPRPFVVPTFFDAYYPDSARPLAGFAGSEQLSAPLTLQNLVPSVPFTAVYAPDFINERIYLQSDQIVAPLPFPPDQQIVIVEEFDGIRLPDEAEIKKSYADALLPKTTLTVKGKISVEFDYKAKASKAIKKSEIPVAPVAPVVKKEEIVTPADFAIAAKSKIDVGVKLIIDEAFINCSIKINPELVTKISANYFDPFANSTLIKSIDFEIVDFSSMFSIDDDSEES